MRWPASIPRGTSPQPSMYPPPLRPSKCSKTIFSRLKTASAFNPSNCWAYPWNERVPPSRRPVPTMIGSARFPVIRTSAVTTPSRRSNTPGTTSRTSPAGSFPSMRASMSPFQEVFPETRTGEPAAVRVPPSQRTPSAFIVAVISFPASSQPPSR